MTTRETIVEVVNKLFVYTDYQRWEKLQQEVFSQNVHLDISSLGGPVADMQATEICNMWSEGFEGLDAVNHLAGNYLVQLENDHQAQVFAYATATHYKKSASQGPTREFVGSYDLQLVLEQRGWRINQFVYHLKYATGNLELQ